MQIAISFLNVPNPPKTGIFPGRGSVIWRDWYTHDVVNATSGANTTIDAPLGHINVHIRDGSVLLLHSKPAYTTAETRAGPYSLLISQAAGGSAFGSAYIDDGETIPPTPNRTIVFNVSKRSLKVSTQGNFHVAQKLDTITILGTNRPSKVLVDDRPVVNFQYLQAQQKLVLGGLNIDLNQAVSVRWV